MFFNLATPLLTRRLIPALLCTLLIAPAFAQQPAQQPARNAHHFEMPDSHYQARAGEPARLEIPENVLPFMLKSKRLTVTRDGAVENGIVVGPNRTRDRLMVAASLTKAPGDYPVTIAAEAQDGEVRETSVEVKVRALESASTNAALPAVLLLNGWQMPNLDSFCPIAANGAYDTFGSLPDSLYSIGVAGVYFFDNCVECPNCSIEALGTVLSVFLNSVVDVSQFDLIGHSMGGLIARSYLSGLQPTGIPQPPTTPKVRKLIQVATPNFGAYQAPSFAAVLFAGTQLAELTPGSPLLWNLATWNQRSDDLRGVDALAIAGNGNAAGTGDGVVSTSSASLGFARDPFHTRILPYCHIDFAKYPWFVQQFVDCQGSGIADVDEAPETGQIIQSFLLDTPDWWSIGTAANQDPFLANFGGLYFAQQDSAANWISDFSWVWFGSQPLSAGGAASIFYTDFATGSANFVGYSPSLGHDTCGALSVPVGGYSVWRCKFTPVIWSVTPTNSGMLVVPSNGTIAIHGAGFGNARCADCGIWAYDPNGSPIRYVNLQVSLWTDQTIYAFLPGSWAGLAGLYVQTEGFDHDTITIMASPK